MRFSLILATINRTAELEIFLNSLKLQTFRDFELIVVDQNSDYRLAPILENYAGVFPINNLRSEKGLSRARNKAIMAAGGEILAFPDDDCWYPPNLLEEINGFFHDNSDMDGLTGKTLDHNGRPTLNRWDLKNGFINKWNIWYRVTSCSIFIRNSKVNQRIKFNETLGIGSGTPWSSSEDIDFLLQAIERGNKVYYSPEFIIRHPQTNSKSGEKAILRASQYSVGKGRVLHIHSYPLWFIMYLIFRAQIGWFLNSLIGNQETGLLYSSRVTGLMKGWRGS